jgi:hypothetical protein
MKGHLKERSPGRWAIILDRHDANGKRHRKWHSFKGTKHQAPSANRMREADHRNGKR